MYGSKRSSVSSTTPKASQSVHTSVSKSLKGAAKAVAVAAHARKGSRSIRFADEVPEETTINHVSPYESLDEEDNYNLQMIRGSNTPSLTRKTNTTNRDSLKGGGERSVSALLAKDKENFQAASLYEGLLSDGQKNVAESKRRMIKQTQEDLKTALHDLENVQKEERRQLKARIERIQTEYSSRLDELNARYKHDKARLLEELSAKIKHEKEQSDKRVLGKASQLEKSLSVKATN